MVGGGGAIRFSALSADIFNGTLVTQADEASSCDLDVETDISRLYGPPQYPPDPSSNYYIMCVHEMYM